MRNYKFVWTWKEIQDTFTLFPASNCLAPPLPLLSCINMYTTRHFSNPCLLVKLSKLIEIARKDRQVLDSLRKNIRIRDGLYRQWSKMATLLRRRSKKKKILALAGAKGRHKNMFSAVISTAVSLLVRVKENEAKENLQKRQISVGFGSLLGSLPRDYSFFLYGYYLGGRVQYYSNVCWVMRVSTPPLTVATTVLRQLANSRVIIINFRAE